MKGLSTDIDFHEGYVFNVDKPYEWTSTDVVRKIRFAMQRGGYRKIKVGHAGTLDPLATGVLLVCVGKATKQVEQLQAQEKEYVADIVLGATTPSGDMEHPVDKRYPYEHIGEQDIRRTLECLCGERLQTPPVYSAKKIDGLRAYEYAREGTQVQMKQALITVYEAELMAFEPPVATVRVRCSKGTYIRSLAMEVGESLGSGAYLSSLRRMHSGEYDVKDAVSVEEIADFFGKLKQN